MSCPDDETLAAYLGGELETASRRDIDAHLDGCASCRAAAGAVAKTDLLSSLPATTASDHPALTPGDRIGRYVILHEIGRGGMGVVYAGYDSELDRTVAVKLVSGGAERVRREARALAKLAHPNVVSVFDVAGDDDQVVIVMEHIRGHNLRQWLAQRSRSWRELAEVFLAAGRGLRAAHDAGLCHCDFKPQNVLISETGRVCVADFGLADRAGAAAGGTPAYLSPEQLAGQPATAASDQYSFCVALHEALLGARPAPADTVVAAAEKHRGVPLGLVAAIRRGLARRPGDRHPSMGHLLQGIERALSRRRRRATVAAAIAVAALSATGALALVQRGRAADLCTGASRHVEAVWGPAQRDALRTTSTAFERPDAQAALRFAEHDLDGYAARWQRRYTTLCEATHKWGEQSPAVLDRGMRCLHDRLTAMNAVVRVITESADAAAAVRATRLLATLPSIDACGTPAGGAPGPLPSDPAARAEISELEELLARVTTLARAGRLADAQSLVAPLDQRVATIDHPPLTAAYYQALGILDDRGGHYEAAAQRFQLAAANAALAGDDARLAHIWVSLMGIYGYRQGRPEDGLRWAALAEAAVRHQEDDDELAAAFHHNRGWVRLTAGDYSDAAESFAAAVVAIRRRWGADSPHLADSLDALGTSLYRAGRLDAARAHHERALALAEQALGSTSPELAVYLNNIALIDTQRQDYAAAEAGYRRALQLYEAVHGAEHPEVAMMRANLGDVLVEQGGYDQAQRQYQEAQQIFEHALGPEHPILTTLISSRGRLASMRGEHGEAVRLLERALRLRRTTAADHPQVGDDLVNLANAQCRAGDLRSARTTYDASLQHFREVLGSQDLAVAEALLARADCGIEHDDPEPAIGDAREALAIAEKSGDANDRAAAEFTLARALWLDGTPHRDEALALAQRALGHYQESAAPRLADRQALQRWLSEHVTS